MRSPWLKDDGTINLDALDQLATEIRAVTDHNREIDEILRAARLGKEVRACFQCGESGLLYPSDYVLNWGKLYGIGLGRSPVSESLQSDYDQAPPPVTPETRDITDIMHPLRVSCAQMDLMTYPVEVCAERAPIIALEDPLYRKRVAIIRPKQLANPRGRIKNLMAAYNVAGRN